MLGFVSRRPIPIGRYLVEAPRGLLHMSLHGEKAPHRDGFGYAYLDGAGRLAVCRWGKQALDLVPAGFPGDLSQETTLLIAHARKASPEYRERLPAQDAHPFLVGGFALAHNGGIRDAELLDAGPGIDSLRLARWLARRWRPRTPAALARALEKLLTLVHDYTAVNLLLTDGGSLYAFRRCAEKPDYYGLWFHVGPRLVLVASEPLADVGWQPLADGELLAIAPDLSLSRYRITIP